MCELVSLIGSHTMPGQHSPFSLLLVKSVYMCLGVTCHLLFWQSDRGLLHATAVRLVQKWHQNVVIILLGGYHDCFSLNVFWEAVRATSFKLRIMISFVVFYTFAVVLMTLIIPVPLTLT